MNRSITSDPLEGAARNASPVAHRPGNSTTVDEIEALIGNLRAPEAVARKAARQRLLKIGKPAVPALIRALLDPVAHVRWEAAKTLSGIADPLASPALVSALEDKDHDVRWLAAAALAAQGRDALGPLLSALMERPDSDWLREGAHHVCHDLVHRRADPYAAKMLAALNASEPQMAAPLAAYDVLHALHALRRPQ